MTSAIAFVKHRDLLLRCSKDPNLDQLYSQRIHYSRDVVRAMLAAYGDTRSCYARFGPNTMTQNTNRIEALSFDLDIGSTADRFDIITDSRLRWLHRNCWNKPWLICWSGGIDSTVIVASIIKNLPRADFDNIHIYCNLDSVWLAPRFYQQFIRPNFRVEDSTGFQVCDFVPEHYVIDGDLADYFWPSRYTYQLGASAGLSWRKSSHDLLTLFASKISDENLVQQFLQAVNQNLENVDFPIETNSEWLWWVNFNFKYADGVMRKYFRSDQIDYRTMQQCCINWYHAREYNAWALVQAAQHNHKPNISTHKQPALRYIQQICSYDTDCTVKIPAAHKEHLRHPDADWLALDHDLKYIKDPAEVLAHD